MFIRNPARRHAASVLARTGVAFSIVGLGISVWNMSFSGVPGAAAATDAGAAEVVVPLDAGPDAGQPLTAGGSSTVFTLKLPGGAACSKDSTNDDYRVQSYMVPETVSPNDLTFDSAGPTPAGFGGAIADFRMPLWFATGAAYVDQSTAAADAPGGPGPLVDIPPLSFAVYLEPASIPAGTYNVGIACTTPDRTIEKFWNARMTFTGDPSDQPAGVTWVVEAGGGTTTTTSAGSTSTSEDTSSSTTSTSTTLDDSTTSTAPAGGTPTTGDAGTGSGSYGGSPSAASPVSTAGQLPYTGSSPLPMVVWAVALLVFGRMAMLLGKRPRVVGDDSEG